MFEIIFSFFERRYINSISLGLLLRMNLNKNNLKKSLQLFFIALINILSFNNNLLKK